MTKPTYNNGGQQQTAAAVNNNKGIITLSRGALVGGIVGCTAAGIGLGVLGCNVFGAIKTKRAEKKAKAKAADTTKKE